MRYFVTAFLITAFTLSGGLLGFITVVVVTADLGITIGAALIGGLFGAVIGLAFGIAAVVILRAISKFFQRRN